MIPVLSQACSLQSDFATDIADYASGKCQSVEVWFTKLETYLKDHTLDDVRHLLSENGVTLPVASFHGGLLTSQAAAREAAWDHFRRRIELCQQLEIGTIVVAADVVPPVGQADIDRAVASLAEVAELARANAIRAAIEFQSGAAFLNNLETAATIVGEMQNPFFGLCLDAFHFATGPSKLADIGRLDVNNLFHVQLSDVAGVPREFATDSDRILPGEGDFNISDMIERLQQIGYVGTVSIEVMNPQIWQVPAIQMGEIGMTALRRLLGQSD